MMSSTPKRKSLENFQSTKTITQNLVEDIALSNKRSKSNSNTSKDIPAQKRKNFVRACELVSQRAYFNYAERLQMIYMPVCMDRNSCLHSTTLALVIKEMPQKVMKLINVEMEAGNWCGALEVCIMTITPTQYLSDVVLKNIVEIMLNAHEDLSSGYTISQVLDKCKLVLTLHFSTHCPCLNENIRKVYTNFLISPMDRKERSRTNRTNFGSEEGIVNFCLTRLDYELGADSSDSALLDRTENTPEELRQTIKGLFYQREQFDIFEMLDRTERINRLMAVLHSIAELLQFDLAIWQSIRNSDMRRPLKGQRILLASVLGHKDTCAVTNTCLQILKLFAYFIHLEYPEEHINTMTLWLNAVMELYYNDKHHAKDYPNAANTSVTSVINQFYNIISALPPKSIINILARIKPAHIRHQISHHYCKTLLSSNEKETFRILLDFLKEAKWKDFPRNESNMIMLKKLINMKRVKPNKLLKNLSNICNNAPVKSSHNNNVYPKYYPCPTVEDCEIDRYLITCALYIALQSYLEAYGVQMFQETLQKLNKDLLCSTQEEITTDLSLTPNDLDSQSKCQSYGVTDEFLKKYRHIFEMLKELILTIDKMTSRNLPPEVHNIFKTLFN